MRAFKIAFGADFSLLASRRWAGWLEWLNMTFEAAELALAAHLG